MIVFYLGHQLWVQSRIFDYFWLNDITLESQEDLKCFVTLDNFDPEFSTIPRYLLITVWRPSLVRSAYSPNSARFVNTEELRPQWSPYYNYTVIALVPLYELAYSYCHVLTSMFFLWLLTHLSLSLLPTPSHYTYTRVTSLPNFYYIVE